MRGSEGQKTKKTWVLPRHNRPDFVMLIIDPDPVSEIKRPVVFSVTTKRLCDCDKYFSQNFISQGILNCSIELYDVSLASPVLNPYYMCVLPNFTKPHFINQNSRPNPANFQPVITIAMDQSLFLPCFDLDFAYKGTQSTIGCNGSQLPSSGEGQGTTTVGAVRPSLPGEHPTAGVNPMGTCQTMKIYVQTKPRLSSASSSFEKRLVPNINNYVRESTNS